jgi:hypothetical protein
MCRRLLSASYGLFVFSVVEKLLDQYYLDYIPGQTFTKDSSLSGVALVGTFIGQVMRFCVGTAAEGVITCMSCYPMAVSQQLSGDHAWLIHMAGCLWCCR